MLRATWEQSFGTKTALGSRGRRVGSRWFLSGLLAGPEPRRSRAPADRRTLPTFAQMAALYRDAAAPQFLTAVGRAEARKSSPACPSELAWSRYFLCLGPVAWLNRAMQITVEHIGLPARNPQALVDWYVTTLGGRRVEFGAAGPPFFVALPGAVLEIYEAAVSVAQTGDNGVAGFRHLALWVDALEPAQAELERQGVSFPDPVKPAAGGGRVLFFRDPEGNLLHFVQRPKGFSMGHP